MRVDDNTVLDDIVGLMMVGTSQLIVHTKSVDQIFSRRQ